MKNLNLKTFPTGRSPKGKFYFGDNAVKLDHIRTKDCQVGKESDFNILYDELISSHYEFKSKFETCGVRFAVSTTNKIINEIITEEEKR